MAADKLLASLRESFASKLGRCARCMRLSVAGMVGFAALLLVAEGFGAGPAPTLAAAVPAALFTLWSIAHAGAYVWRGPERATGCKSCAERKAANLRRHRWRVVKSWLRGRPMRNRKAVHHPRCQTCGSFMIRSGACYKCINCGNTSGCA